MAVVPPAEYAVAVLLTGILMTGCGNLRKLAKSDPEVGVHLPARSKRELADAGGTGEGESFARTVRALTGAVIAPFAVAEIIWGAGGRLAGFVPLDGRHFTARQGTGLRLVTSDHPEGVALAEHKFLVHRLGNTVDPLADGKIRTLAWLHVFQNYPIKDLLSFMDGDSPAAKAAAQYREAVKAYREQYGA